MKKIILIFILILTGCYNYQDINDLAIIKTMKIYKINDYYEISIEVINTYKDTKKNTIYKTNGETIDELFTNIENTCPLNISYDHIMIVLINNDMLNEFNSLINYLLKEKHMNDDIYLLINDNNININDNELIKLLKKNHTITLYDILNNYLNYSNLFIPSLNEVLYE